MRYRGQQQYINGSRVGGSVAAAVIGAFAIVCLESFRPLGPLLAAEFAAAVIALAVFIYYTPDYLHLTVALDKPLRWQVKVRWRILAACFILGLFSVSSLANLLILAAAMGWLLAANYLAPKLGKERPALYFSSRDLALVAVLLFYGRLSLLMAAAIIAASTCLSVVTARRFPVSWGIFNSSIGCFILVGGYWRGSQHPEFFLAAAALVLISALGTALLVRRAQRHNALNMAAALRELMDFTGYSKERVRELWAISNQELAKNWNTAALHADDADRLAQWYRNNSELYLFAISAYNLEYKRIRSNLKVLRYAKGSCLDYGAGNGEIVLEIARRGQPATYYDVEAVTMNFARRRAAEQELDVHFFHSKQDLAAGALNGGFETIFSFDVLEHLPDLQGELSFLASLLRPGGLLVFDVPAGSTKAHPMHLNHRLDVHSFLTAKGLIDERGLLQKLPFRKEEKYFFRAPAERNHGKSGSGGTTTPVKNQSRKNPVHHGG